MTLDIFKNKTWGSNKRGGGGGLHLSLVQLFHQPSRQSKLSMAWERKNGREALMPPICPFAMINEVIRSVKSRFFFVYAWMHWLQIIIAHCTWALFTAHLSTVSDLTNQIMIPESVFIDGRHQNKVYRIPHPFFSPTPRSTLEPVRRLLFDFLRECLSSWSTQFQPNFVLLSPFHLYSSRCLEVMSLVRILP